MPMIVETKHRHVVLADKVLLELQHGILFQTNDGVLVKPERRLVRDDQVLPSSRGSLDYVERSHHRGGDALYGNLRVPGHEFVHRFGPPRDTDVLLDPLDDLASGGCRAPKGKSCPGKEKSASRNIIVV